MKYQFESSEQWRRELARLAAEQRALKIQRRDAWSATSEGEEPGARRREAARAVMRGEATLRALHLAHAWVRDRPIWTQERRARERRGELVVAVAEAAGTTVENVRVWIECPVPEAERVAFDEHVERIRASAMERRALRRAARESSS